MTETIFDEIADMTVHVVTDIGTGTGFFFRHDKDGLQAFLLLTNRHVLEGAKTAALAITYGDPTIPAQPGKTFNLTFEDLQTGVIFHPGGADLAAVPLAKGLELMVSRGYSPRLRALGFKDFVEDETEFGLAQDVLMVGYPQGIVDRHNNRPIVRRGITATSYARDYEGKAEFVIDAACFPGSSGSPIVVANDTAFFDRDGKLMSGSRFRFLGVLWGGPTMTATGELRPEPIPTAVSLSVRTELMMNLGFCIKARTVKSFIEGILEKPPGASGST